MDDLADRAARVANDHPSAVLSFQELGRLVRGSGVTVSDEILFRSVSRASSRFRVIDPWQGPWRALLPPSRHGVEPEGERGEAAAAALGADEHLPPGPWIVPRAGTTPGAPGGDPLALRRLRASLLRLGWRLDARSGRDLARWCGLVGEGGRVRQRLGAT